MLAAATRRYAFEVHAFAILHSHFHLLVRTIDGDLAGPLGWVQAGYCQLFNERHDRDGPLVRGRYRSREVADAEYRRLVIGYIDWNPVAAGLARSPEQYFGGSAQWLAHRTTPRWLSDDWVRHLLGDTWTREDYLARFTPTSTQYGAVAARLEHGRHTASDPTLTFEAEATARWLLDRARIADGDVRRHAPVLEPTRVLQALQEADARVVVGTLRSLCALSFRRIGRLTQRSHNAAHRAWEQHCEAMQSDDAYQAEFLAICQDLLTDEGRVTIGTALPSSPA